MNIEALQESLTGSLFLFEMISAALVFSLPLEKRRRFALRFAAALFGFSLLMAVFSHFWTVPQEINTDAFPIWIYLSSCFYVFVLMVALIWFTRAISVREALYCGTCAYLMEHVAYCVRLLFEYYAPELPSAPGSVLYFSVHIATYAAFYFAFARSMVKNRHYASTALSSLNFTVVVLAVVLVMSVLASEYDFENIHAIYATIFSVFMLYAQIDNQRKLNLETELEFQRSLTAQQKAQYEMSRENIELINRKCHDLKHQIAALRHLSGEKRNESIRELEDSVMIYDAIYKTGSDILDTVLTEKSLLCRKNAITLSVIADGKRVSFLDPVDAYTLFGNALDNAIEAVGKLPDGERFIDLAVRDMLGLTILKLTNSYQGEIKMIDGLPETSKEDKDYHGFGVRSIKAVAEKYGGIVKIDAGDGKFTLQISFPPQS